jgi:outer membrane protein assembly factor BamD
MRYIVNSLAEADVIVARFYYQRGAYLAAANRAQLHMIKDYDRAPAMEEALYILIKSYEKLGLTQFSNDSLRVFKLNFQRVKCWKRVNELERTPLVADLE